MKQYLPLETRILYYSAYILPIMDNCLTVWWSASKYQLDRLLRLQKHTTRMILDMLMMPNKINDFEEYLLLFKYTIVRSNKAKWKLL